MIWIIVILLIVIGLLIVEIYDMCKTEKSKKYAMHTLLNVQAQQGAYNYNEYELGMWQGMENMLAKYEDRKPTYMDPTKVNFIDSYKKR
ncbi:hypothetical protein [uncultured Clostridium sp.]|uniref:hypothetical protein n=1 Tax=uncultured Clostridium sp. TaxID=59620 RepID=UPI00262E1C7C|nr:hypothetical protein [uncultured Clostridium sp.]